MIKRVKMRTGYQRAAAGVVGCLLMGGTIGLALHRREPVAVTEDNPSIAVRALPPLAETLTEGATINDDGAYLALLSRERYRPVASAGQPKAYAYRVKEGDSLWSIAQGLDTDMNTLLSLNNAIDPNLLQPGQTLQVVEHFHGLAYSVEAGDTLEQIAGTYGVTPERIQEANGLETDSILMEGRQLFLPGARPRSRMLLASRSGPARNRTVATVAPAAAEPAAPEAPTPAVTHGRNWMWPISGGLLSSEFGARWGGWHTGIDIAVPTGTIAVAAQAGTVVFSGWDGGYGYCVIIDHGNGVKTRYAHASALLVSTGQTVVQGAPVIEVGSTGHATGPHLHFEVIVSGTPQNPRNYLP